MLLSLLVFLLPRSIWLLSLYILFHDAVYRTGLCNVGTDSMIAIVIVRCGGEMPDAK